MLIFYILAINLRTPMFNIKKFYMVLTFGLCVCTDLTINSDFTPHSLSK